MIYYNLSQNIESNKLLSDIKKLLDKNNLQDKILVIELREIKDYLGESPLLKLEYKDEPQ